MTPKPAFTRSDFVRQRRPSRTSTQARTTTTARPETTARKSYRPESLLLPGKPAVRRDPQPASRYTTRSARASAGGQSYDIAFSLGRASVRAPSLSIPQFGPRWISAGITLVLVFLLFTMWTGSLFNVSAAEITGNARLAGSEISAATGMVDEPVFKAVPAQIEKNLRLSYPDLASVHVRVTFPNHVKVDVVERMPMLAWYQNGVMTWIDANGVAFMPRGEVPGLVQVSANGAPPTVANDPETPLYDQKFMTPDMVETMVTLAPIVPAGLPMIFDPQYGMGWQDPRGWFVYFGQNTTDIPMKMVVYQAIVDSFILQGIQPALISVEYLDAPIYK
jgi:cell division protein FtsQ